MVIKKEAERVYMRETDKERKSKKKIERKREREHL